MKKLFFTACAVLALGAATAARAQGTVDFANDSSTLVLNSTSGLPVATTDNASAALYWSPDGIVSYVQLGAAVPVGSPADGLLVGGTRTTGNATAGGTSAMFLVRVWVGNYTNYEAALGSGAPVASSPAVSVVTGDPAGSPPTPPASLVAAGLTGFSVAVPVVPPVITSQPISRTRAFGATVSFSVTATGTAPLAYQWYLNGSNALAGKTAASCTISNAQAADAGDYSVTVSNAATVVTSSNATLTLLNAPAIQTQPAAQSVLAGSNATFSVGATGSAPLTYQWRFNSTNVLNATNSSYTVTNAGTSKQGNYFVLVSNAVGVAISSNALLTIITPPAITTQPTNRTVAAGGSTTFFAGASGSAPLAYQWRINGTNIPGATASGYVLSNAQPSDAGSYSVTVSNAAGFATSSNAVLTVTAPLSCIAPPANLTAWWQAEGDTSDFMGGPPGTNVAVAYSAGEVGQAFNFNGTNAYVGIASTAASKFTGPFTAEGWINYRTTGGIGDQIIVKGPDAETTQDWGMMVLNGTHQLRIMIKTGGTWYYFDGAANLASNTWYHVAMVYDGTTTRGYVNGVQDSTWTTPGTLSASDNPVRIGAYAPVNGTASKGWFDGKIDELSLYNRALTTNELAGIYLASSAGKCTTVQAPAITAQPQPATVTAGFNATFSVTASGNPLAYQWRFNTTNILNATNSTCTLVNAQAADAGSYSVVVSNSAGTATSSNAVLTVNNPACLTPPANLTAWWQAEGDASDFTGGSLGTNVAVTYAAGKVAQAFNFNGTNAYLGVPSSPANKFTNAFTVEGWINYRTLSGIGDSIITKGPDSESTMDWGFMVLNGTRQLRVMIKAGGSWYYFDGAATLASNTWYHVAMVYNGTTTRGYVNGVQDSTWTTPGTLSATDNALRIGAYAPVNGTASKCWFDGKIDELSLYNRALTTNELAGIYLASSAGKCPTVQVPVITAQPQGLAVAQNNNATFSVAATGGLLAYQWRLNGTNLAGGTGLVYTVTSAQGSNAGNYSVVVSNSSGTVTSSNAALSVILLPVITNQPQGQVAVAGTPVTFSVGVTGTPPLGYLWFWSGHPIPGATNTTYTMTDWTNYGAGYYFVVVSNAAGMVTSTSAQLTVGTPPAISAQPQNQNVMAGSPATFSVTASGLGTLGYQWRFNGTNLSGAVTNTLTLPPVQSADAGAYSVLVSNLYGVTVSSNATLTVGLPQCYPIPSNLTASWSAEGSTADSVSLTVGTNNSVAYSAGELGQAFDFNGTNAYLGVPSSPANKFTNAFTIEGWINYRTLSGIGDEVIVKGPDSETTMDWGLIVVNGTHKLRVMIKTGGTWYYFEGAAVLASNTWYHVAMVYDGTTTRGFVNGLQDSTWITPGTLSASDNPLRIGAYAPLNGTASKCWFDGKIDELSLYNRALSAGELAGLYLAGSFGKCPPADTAPAIAGQPQPVTVVEGGTAAFSVAAVGSTNLAYQWYLNGSNAVAGATAATLSLTNVQLGQAGDYSVTVSNALGSVTSSNAALTVGLLPAEVRITSPTAMSGAAVSVPVLLVARGRENAAGFSLNFNPAQLTYSSVVLGADAGGASLLLNATGVSTGRLGVGVGLASGLVFPAGTQQLVVVTFTSPVNTSTSAVTAALSFADVPVARQVSATNPVVLPANYFGGTLTLLPTDLEGDTAPRPGGDRAVGIIDWVQAGRYAALLDTPADGPEFQRADCAPRGTGGDGLIKVTDWVQAGRYAAGLDPLTPVSGPTNAASGSRSSGLLNVRPQGGARQLSLTGANAVQGVPVTVAVNLQSLGDENAVGFSISFDAAKFTYVSATNGSGADGATLNINPSQAAAGKLGMVLALPTGTNFAAGACELVRLTVLPTGNTGTVGVAFTDSPLPRSISDAAANELAATYATGTVTVNPVPALDIHVQGTNAALTWPANAEGFNVQVCTGGLSTNWSDLGASAHTNGGSYEVTLPTNTATRWFRLRHP